jgi:hypothetical protein
VNVAVVAPADTVTDAGTVSSAVLLATVTAAPPAGAGWLIVAMQFDVDPPLKLPGVQVTEERAGMLMPPPFDVSGATAEPVALTPTALTRPIGLVVALGVSVS